MDCPYCGSNDVSLVKRWRMRSYEVSHYRCNKCGGSFNHYRDPSSGREFVLRTRRTSAGRG